MPASTYHLCFHGIGEPGRELEPGESAYWVDERVFCDVLDLVAERVDVRVSFDDGNASDVEIALPALAERGLRASFFVLAGRLDRPGSLSRDDVRRLVAAGMSVGTHGMNHMPWRGLPAGDRHAELVGAREVLADVTGTPIRQAALPLGRYDRRVLGELRRLGYERVYSSDRRPARPYAWLQPRFSVGAHDSTTSVAAMLRPLPTGVRVVREAVGLVKRWR